MWIIYSIRNQSSMVAILMLLLLGPNTVRPTGLILDSFGSSKPSEEA